MRDRRAARWDRHDTSWRPRWFWRLSAGPRWWLAKQAFRILERNALPEDRVDVEKLRQALADVEEIRRMGRED